MTEWIRLRCRFCSLEMSVTKERLKACPLLCSCRPGALNSRSIFNGVSTWDRVDVTLDKHPESGNTNG